jgi:DNA-binding transcriptional regulator YhcF (GntR family)
LKFGNYNFWKHLFSSILKGKTPSGENLPKKKTLALELAVTLN